MTIEKRIAFSSGHGLSSRVKGMVDPGATGFGDTEAKETDSMCTNLSQDFARLAWKVLDRDTGDFATADDAAKAFDAKVFIEYHLNAAGASAHGVECWISARPNGNEAVLADNIMDGIGALGFSKRGVKRTAAFAALHQYVGMDTVLVEAAFISNRKDNDNYARQKLKIELAIMNQILRCYGFGQYKSLPRTWGNLKAYLFRITHR